MAAIFSGTADAVALTGGTTKTIMTLGTSSTVPIKILQWWVEFDGVTATNTPVKIEITKTTSAATGASAGDEIIWTLGSQTAATAFTYSSSSEGSPTLYTYEIHRVPPTGGILIQYPMGREQEVPVSYYWRVRATSATSQNVNCAVGVVWEE